MDIIQLLPDSVANQIAAGEVIQRPASVIKELVENSIDAGAKTIKVLVVGAGKTSIQVIDDGCGMSDTDARLSFERHATSKIRKADDLFSLHTMGFRGEALASIAAVAQVTLQTRQKDAELGSCLRINGSRVDSQEPVVCPVGTNFLIENLFYNVPVRRKFLKKDSTEMSHITQTFERIVLVYPDINFVLYHNGQEMLNLRATNLRQRVLDVFGKRLNQVLLPFETDTSLCKIKGFVGKPESARKKHPEQFFFVNGRYMNHAYFHKAVMVVYERLIPAGEQIPYFIYMDVNPADIDVNIHPVKTEIKFENEKAIWDILMAAVRGAIGRFSDSTLLDFDVEGRPDIPVYNPESSKNVLPPSVDYDPSYNPFKVADDKAGRGVSSKQLTMREGNKGGMGRFSSSLGISTVSQHSQDWQQLYDNLKYKSQLDADADSKQTLFPSALNDEFNNGQLPSVSHEYLQYRGMYILVQIPEGMMIVDQHRADVCILYNYYMQVLSSRTPHTQKILFPETVQFPPSYKSLLDAVIEEMCCLGFEIIKENDNEYSISGVPAGLAGLDTVTLVNELVDAAVECNTKVTEEINSTLAIELAQRAATPYGEVLDHDSMENMVNKLLQCENYKYTPRGEKTVSILRHEHIESLF